MLIYPAQAVGIATAAFQLMPYVKGDITDEFLHITEFGELLKVEYTSPKEVRWVSPDGDVTSERVP